MSTLGWRVMRTTGLPSGQAETPVKWELSILSLFKRFSISNIVRLNDAPSCLSSLTSKMFLLSLTEVLMEVMLLYEGPPAEGLALFVGPQAPLIASFLCDGDEALIVPPGPPLISQGNDQKLGSSC